MIAALAAPVLPTRAADCLPTGHQGLTARLVNPSGRVTGRIDAQGCDLGVFIDRGQVAIEGAVIRGAAVAGVLALGEGGSLRLGIEDSELVGLGPEASAVVLDGASAAVSSSRLQAGPGGALRLIGVAPRAIVIGNEFVSTEPRQLARPVLAESGATTLRANVARWHRPGIEEQREEITVPGDESAGATHAAASAGAELHSPLPAGAAAAEAP
jgi:hypothetical protein